MGYVQSVGFVLETQAKGSVYRELREAEIGVVPIEAEGHRFTVVL